MSEQSYSFRKNGNAEIHIFKEEDTSICGINQTNLGTSDELIYFTKEEAIKYIDESNMVFCIKCKNKINL